MLQRFANRVQNMDDALAAAGLAPWAGSALTVCQWGGVTCAAGSMRVVNVSLPGFGLRGVEGAPAECVLFLLPHLKEVLPLPMRCQQSFMRSCLAELAWQTHNGGHRVR